MKKLNLPKPFFVLAPMDDVTDTVFRQLIAKTAPPDLYVTEFVNVDGLQSPGREKLLPKLQFTNKERPIIAQVWGKSPENYFKTAKEIVAMGFDGIDINMGCPDKNIVKNGCCAALINNRGLTGEIIEAVREGVGRDFPISVKTRLGYNDVDYTWHEYLLSFKLNMLTIHARTKKQMSKVPADWGAVGYIAKLRTSLAPQTLIVGNGDVLSRDQGLNLAKKYALDGVMIGRGVFSDPFIFTTGTSPWPTKTKKERIELYTLHVKLYLKTWARGERKLHTLNKFCKVYIQDFPGAKELREKLMNAKSSDELIELLRLSL